MKKILLILVGFSVSAMPFVAMAATNNFEIIPESQTDVSQDVTDIGRTWWSVRDRLNQKANDYEQKGDLGATFASGAFTRNTILNYIVYLVRFLSQVALVIWAGMIVVSGYKYATAAFTGKPAWSKDIKNAIIGVLVVIFSYAIIKILTAAFL
jgi:hypothetical protein